MHPVECWLIACVGVNGRHIAALNADKIIQDFGDRGEAVGGAGCVRDDFIVAGQRVMVHAEDDGLVGICAGRRNQDALGASFKVGRSFVLGGEDAGTFHRNINTHFAPRQIGRVALSKTFEAARPDSDCVSVDRYVLVEAAMHTVILQKVRICIDRAEIIDGNDFDVFAVMLDD